MATICKSGLLNFVAARAEFIQLNIEAGMQVGSAAFLRMSEAAAKAVQTHINAVAGIPAEKANQLITKFLEMNLEEEHRRACVSAVNQKVWLAYQDPLEAKKPSHASTLRRG